jgi:hypothetical protein
VEVSSTVELESPLLVAVVQVAAELVIDTACHVSTQSIKATLPAHEGQRVSIAYQTVKPHAQITPKNPIVESDVTLSPSALNVSAEMAGTVYAGYYTEITPDPVSAATFMYPGGVIVSTSVESGLFRLGYGTELDLAVIDVSPTANIDATTSIRAMLHPAQVESTCAVDVSAVSVDFAFHGIELVATGYAAQDDLPIKMAMQDTQVWHDNNVQANTQAANTNIGQHIVTGDANSYAETGALNMDVGSHEVSVSGKVDIPSPVEVRSSVPHSSVHFDYLLPAALQRVGVGVQAVDVGISASVFIDTLPLHAVLMRPDYSGPMVAEFALLQSSLQRQVVLDTPVNAYSRASEVEA